MAKPLDIREAPVKVLHQRQIVLLREWRELLAVMLPPKLDSL